MFNYMFKNVPSKYIFAGYNVRKSLSVMTTDIDGKVLYDVFSYVYLDNFLSFYILMEDGTYKNVERKINVSPCGAEEIMSRHLYRGETVDSSSYETFNKDEVVGVFGLRNIDDLIKQADKLALSNNTKDISMEAMIDAKSQYNGMEINGVINKFNENLGWEKGEIEVPPIKYSLDDTFKSLIGDEVDYFEFMSGKDSDTIVRELKNIVDKLDGVGNQKEVHNSHKLIEDIK